MEIIGFLPGIYTCSDGNCIMGSPPIGKEAPKEVLEQTKNDIADCCVDGYRFSWLRSRADFRAAGEALNNCLISWQSTGNPVVAVKRDGRYVAAVEVSDGMVVQARSADNQSMESVPSLNAAYLKWLDKFHLVQRPFLDLFDDDIPF